MAFDYQRALGRADRLIKRFGQAATLRRATGDRACICVLMQYSPRERVGSMIQATDQHAYISPVGLTIDPDNEEDKLVVNGVQYDIVAPAGRFKPAGVVLYWDLQVRR